MSIALGFDFGLKHIGVAVGQCLTQTATPLTSLAAIDGLPSPAKLEDLIKEWQPDVLVVGIPLAMDNSKLSVTNAAQEFVNFLKTQTKLPVYAVDERLTTKEAKRLLFEKKGARALKKTAIDSLSATLILEDWLKYGENPHASTLD